MHPLGWGASGAQAHSKFESPCKLNGNSNAKSTTTDRPAGEMGAVHRNTMSNRILLEPTNPEDHCSELRKSKERMRARGGGRSHRYGSVRQGQGATTVPWGCPQCLSKAVIVHELCRRCPLEFAIPPPPRCPPKSGCPMCALEQKHRLKNGGGLTLGSAALQGVGGERAGGSTPSPTQLLIAPRPAPLKRSQRLRCGEGS